MYRAYICCRCGLVLSLDELEDADLQCPDCGSTEFDSDTGGD